MTKGTYNQPYVMFCGDEVLSLDKGPYHLSLWTVDMRAKYRRAERMDKGTSFEDAKGIGMFRIGQLLKGDALVFESIHYRPIVHRKLSVKRVVLLHEPREGYNDPEHNIIMSALPTDKDIWLEVSGQD